MTRLTAYPQTEREAMQIHTIAFLVLLKGKQVITEDGVQESHIKIPNSFVEQFKGMGVHLYLETEDDGDTLIVQLYEPESPVIEGEAEDVEE